jgi:hypothetical protein
VSVTIALSVEVDAPVERTWAAATDWDRQGEWVLGTTVRAEGEGLGAQLAAFTGVGRLGFVDTMTVTTWDPPRRCAVLHTGRVVRGTGDFAVRPLGGGRSAFDWREDLDLPMGALGRAGWPLARPLFVAGLRRSLRRFASWAAAYEPPAS